MMRKKGCSCDEEGRMTLCHENLYFFNNFIRASDTDKASGTTHFPDTGPQFTLKKADTNDDLSKGA